MLASPKGALTHLILANNRISINGVYALGHSLGATTPGSKHVLDVAPGDPQSELYGDNATLQVLNLRLNRIGDEGGAELCTLLLRNNTLCRLDISANDLGKETTTALATLIRKNGKKLVSIDVSCNKLGSGVAPGHVSSVPTPSGGSGPGSQARINSASSSTGSEMLDSLSVEHDAAGKTLFEAISHNKYISHLDLRVTDIPVEYVAAIQGIIVENGQGF